MGHYEIRDLQPGGFTVAVTHPGYHEQAKGVGLAADTTLDFALAKILRADLVAEGVITYYPQPPDYVRWSFEGTARNVGDGCATQIAGTTRMYDGLGEFIAERAFTLRPDLIARPSELFDYEGCCFDNAATQRSRSYRLEFTWTEAPNCP